MSDKEEILLHREIEKNIDEYSGFYAHTWANEIKSKLPPKYTEAFDYLCLTWKEASNTSKLPGLMILQMQGFTHGFINKDKSRMDRLIERFRDWIFNEMDGALRRVDKKAINGIIKKLDQGIRIEDQNKDCKFPAREYWGQMVDEPEIQLSISGSQNLAYCALFFGYEWFLVSCLAALSNDYKLRKSLNDPFWTEFKDRLDGDPKTTYWDGDSDICIAKTARDCIVHQGGKVDDSRKCLLKEPPPLYISDEKVLSIKPLDNKQLFTLLKDKVSQLVEEIKAKV